MIAKISTGVNTDGMVNYNHSKTKKSKNNTPDAILLSTNLININSNSDVFFAISNTIKSRNSFSNNVEKKNIHISLNFHKDDILTNEAILKIGKDYMEQMGYANQPYAVYRHFDKEHPHIHIVSSQIGLDGKKINDSNLYYRSVSISRQLEEKYNITKAVGKKSSYSKTANIQRKIDEHLEHGKHSLTAILNTVLLEVMKNKPISEEQFIKLLEEYQIKQIISYNQENKPIGHSFALIPDDYFGNENDNLYKNSKGIPGNELDINFSLFSILEQIDINLKEKKTLQNTIMGRIYSVINPIKKEHSEKNTKEKISDLILKLQKKGIELELKRSQTGENLNTIYGLLFKDIKTGHRYSATEIKLKTKDFLFAIEDDLKDKNLVSIKNEDDSDNKREEEDTSPTNNNDVNKTMKNFIDILFGSLAGGGNQTENAPASKKKRKRPKR